MPLTTRTREPYKEKKKEIERQRLKYILIELFPALRDNSNPVLASPRKRKGKCIVFLLKPDSVPKLLVWISDHTQHKLMLIQAMTSFSINEPGT